MSKPRLSKAAEQLRSEINAKYPKRDKRSDGWIGDTSHNARKSDHNPDKLEAAPAKLIPILVKAIQELSAKVEALEAKAN